MCRHRYSVAESNCNCSGGIATATANASSKHSIAYRANYVRLKSFNLLNLNQIETFYRSLAFAYLLYINTSVSAFSQSTMRQEYSHAEKVCVHRGRKREREREPKWAWMLRRKWMCQSVLKCNCMSIFSRWKSWINYYYHTWLPQSMRWDSQIFYTAIFGGVPP